MRKKLEFQADRIEAMLSSHDVSAKVTGGTVTPRWIRFQVLPDVGAKVSNIRDLHEEIAMALDAPNCRVSRRGAAIAIEVPRDDPRPVRLLPLYKQLQEGRTHPIPPVTAILGVAEDGAPLLIRLPSPDVGHILVAGAERAGKTTLLKAMVLSLATEASRGTVSMILAGCEFGSFVNLPHLAHLPAVEIPDMSETLRSLAKTLEYRLRSDEKAPRIVLFIDDLDRLISIDPKGTGERLTKITSQGREVGIHIIAATESAEEVSLTPSFPVRIVGRVASAEDARLASGCSGTGAERLLGRGDFIAVAEGRVTRFQAAHVSAEEIQEAMSQLMETTQ